MRYPCPKEYRNGEKKLALLTRTLLLHEDLLYTKCDELWQPSSENIFRRILTYEMASQLDPIDTNDAYAPSSTEYQALLDGEDLLY